MGKVSILCIGALPLALLIALGPAVPVILAQSGGGMGSGQHSATPTPRGTEVPKQDMQASGRTYALVIGISRYHSPFTPLQFADKDAEKFVALLKQPLGGSLKGGLRDDEIMLLTNERATRAAIDDAVKNFVQPHASRNNTLVLFVAAHGVDLETEADPVTHRVIEHEPYIVTYNAEQQDLKTSSYPMGELRRLSAEQAMVFGHVFVFVDVCHAANVAGIQGLGGQEPAVQQVFRGDAGELGMLLAAHAHKYAYESPSFGGGHGAFSYFLISGLSGAAAMTGATSITWADVSQYVSHNVYVFTARAQQTDDKATNSDMVIVDTVVDDQIREAVTKAVSLGPAKPLSAGEIRDLRHQRAVFPAVSAGGSAPVRAGEDDFEKAINQPGGAASLLAHMRQDPTKSTAEIQESARRLHVALDDRGEEILSRYLEGEQRPQTKADFLLCARYFKDAQHLAADSSFEQSRALFCQGRALIFDAQYDTAEQLLKESIRIDPRRAYAYNALGIAELERSARTGQGLDSAASAFLCAIRFAPYWAYPVHNLALVESERGKYEEAIRLYARAMTTAPYYSYLPYNLGLLYERLGDLDNAELWFDQACEVAEKAAQSWSGKGCESASGAGLQHDSPLPERSAVWNAMGTLARSQGRERKAIHRFQNALVDNPDNADARHNLALLLAKQGEFAKADELWRSNMALAPIYLPSWIAHAQSLVARGNRRDAIRDYEQVLKEKPEYVAALQAIAELYIEEGDAGQALIHLNAAVKLSPSNAALLEMRGDAYATLRSRDAALPDWNAALKLADSRAVKARLKRKLNSGTGGHAGNPACE